MPVRVVSEETNSTYDPNKACSHKLQEIETSVHSSFLKLAYHSQWMTLLQDPASGDSKHNDREFTMPKDACASAERQEKKVHH